MKNKRANKSEQRDQGIKNPLNKNLNLKNREQIRKKLKGLFEKDPKNLHLLAAGKNTVQSAPKVFNDIRKANSSKNVNNKEGIQGNDKSKSSKQSTANGKKIPKERKSPDVPLKRKCPEKLEKSKMAKNILKSKDIPKVVPNTAGKDLNHEFAPKKKIKRSKQIENKNEKVASKQKAKINNGTKTTNKEESIFKPYRGPLRPNTKNAGLEKVSCIDRTLARFECENDESSDQSYETKESYFSSSETYSDDNSEDSFQYDDDISYSQCGTSNGLTYYDSDLDSTYELPEDVPEDVYKANGMAVKHDFLENNEVDFDSETSSAQIIEIHTKSKTGKTVNKSSFALTNASNVTNANHADNNKYESDDSCPELVPIDHKRHMHDNISSDSCSDCYSFSGSETDSDTDDACFSEANDSSFKHPEMTPVIFHADKTTRVECDMDFFHTTNYLFRNWSADSLLKRITNPKGSNSSSYKIYTTNNEIVNLESLIKVAPNTIKERSENLLGCKNKEYPNCEIIRNTPTLISNKMDETPSERSIVKRSIDTLFNESPFNKKTVATLNKTLQGKSPFQTLFFNAINSNHVIVLLKNPLYIYGTVKLKLFAGSLEIFGYNPKQNEVLEIFSPRGYSSLKIEASKNTALNAFVNEKELLSLTPYFIRTDLEEIIEKFDANKDAVVILERNDRSKKVNMLKKYMIEHLFPNMNSIQSDRPFYTSEFLLRCIITPRNDKALIVDPRWRSITITNNSRVMVIGGKSVGKSTLVRYLINRNLNKYPNILLIDLDIGQPEMFIPQTVSVTTLNTPLLGPGYFLNKDPDKAFLVGQTNVVLLPKRYIETVQALMEYCKANNQYRDIPWIVNTMGYNKGFGDELIAIICNLLHPTNIVQLESNREINNFDVIMSKDNLESLECKIIGDMVTTNAVFRPQHHLTLMKCVIPNDRKFQKEWDMNPRDMRLAIIISRLSTILTGHAEWLTDIKPVCASIDDLKIINMGDDQINKEDLLKTLIGNLVYLCREESGQVTECFGIGIVRGVDYPLKQIYLLPAVSLDVLKKVNCLAICGIPLPSSILIHQGPKVKGLAPYVYNTVDKAASMHIKQIYHRPQHFLTGRHKSVVE